MRVPCTLLTDGASRDLIVTADTSALIGEIADRIAVGMPLGQPHLRSERTPQRRRTLRVRLPDAHESIVLDRHRTLGESLLRPGCIVEIISDEQHGDSARRQYPFAAALALRPADGADDLQRVYGLVVGENALGRDAESRVHLPARDVSRRHARIIIDDNQTTITDLGSANGIEVNGQPVRQISLQDGDLLTIGTQRLRFSRLSPVSQQNALSAHATPREEFVPAPRLVPRFTAQAFQLPTAPRRNRAQRMPVLAALTPLLAGAAMFFLTQSPYSLILMFLAPLTYFASWIDAGLGAGRDYRRDLAVYRQSLQTLEETMASEQRRERELRQQADPALGELLRHARRRGPDLWSRRPEHQTFLELRFGQGTDLSLITSPLLERGELPDEVWQQVTALTERFAAVADVPVLEKLQTAGAVGVTGPEDAAEDALRAMALQLIITHSPADLVFTAFCPDDRLNAWEWLKWIPHVDSPQSPITGSHLASDERSAHQLVNRLEELLGDRLGRPATTTRSCLPGHERAVQARSRPAVRPQHRPVVICLIAGNPGVDSARLVQLAEDGPDADLYVLWLAPTTAQLPAACRTWLQIASDLSASLCSVRTSTTIRVTSVDRVSAYDAAQTARSLSAVVDSGARVVDETDLPARVLLRDLTESDLSESVAAVIHRWRTTDSLVSEWETSTQHRPQTLHAVVGQSAEGPFGIDLRTQGPHALVGGTTGAGKSEFLQTWIMSMAATISPDRLNILLIDYKGGTAFAECVLLPHTVGLVTDLDPHLVRRTLTSLRAELTRRERLFNEVGAKDLHSMEQLRDPRSPPMLVIVIDEFAALASDVPEFVDGIVDIAARGRSLGVHLILATQRPAGVITENLRANANLRIALRMADEQDSSDVIGMPSAAHFPPSNPGRAAVRIGPGRVRHFQGAFVGAVLNSRREPARITVQELPFGHGAEWPISAGRGTTRCGDVPREIEGMLHAIRGAGDQLRLARPRRPWLDALPEHLDVGALPRRRAASPAPTVDGCVELGLADDPFEQRQVPYAFTPRSEGHLRVLGTSGSGRSQTLRTLAWQLSRAAVERPVQIYAIEGSGSALSALRELPTVGAVIDVDDVERLQRLSRLLHEELGRRLDALRERRVADIDEYEQLASRRAGSLPALPRIHLLIDDFGALQERYEFSREVDLIGDLAATLTSGRTVGIHCTFTTTRATGLPNVIAASVSHTLVLRISDPTSAALLEVDTAALDAAGPGRGFAHGGSAAGLEVQIGLPGGADTVAEQSRLFSDLGERLTEAGVVSAPEVRRLPTDIELDALPALDSAARPVFGLSDDTLAPIGLPLHGPLLVQGRITGENETVLAMLLRAVVRTDPSAETVCLAPTRTLLAERVRWTRSVTDANAVTAHVDDLLGSLAAADSMPIIVIERAADFAGTSAETRIAALIRTCRQRGSVCLVDVDPALAPSAWELHAALRTIGQGLVLRPDPGDGELYLRTALPCEESTRWPVGRGYLIVSGVPRRVQVAR